MDLDRARGALLGLAVGDALGTTLEFTSPDAPPFPTLAKGPHREITGGGPFRVAPGQVTDDTQMACCLAASLVAHGRFDAEDVAKRYVEWQRHAFDVGNQTAAALHAIAKGTPALEAGRIVWEARDRQPAANGSLMRTAPIGVFFADDPQALRRAAADDSAITHFDPRCRHACIAFDAAIAAGLHGASAREMLAAAREDAEHPDLRDDLDAAERDDPDLYGRDVHVHRHAGFVRVAFRLAFWELLHAPSYEAALVDVVNRGGDSDTNGAIAGALLGALHGFSSIPRRWRERVLDALQGDPPGPLRDTYHPKRLLELLKR